MTENNLRQFLTNLPLGMHCYRLEGDGRLVLTEANSAADTILGLDHQQYIGKTIEEAFPHWIATEIPAKYKEVAVSGKPWQQDQVLYKDEQITRAFEVNAFQTGDGSIAALFSEITGRKQIELELRKSNEVFEEVFQSSPAAIVSVDKNKKVRTWNHAAQRIFGWSREEVLGQPLPYIPDDRQEEYLALQAAAMSGDVAAGHEVTRRRRDGSSVELSLSTAALRTPTGEADGFMAVVLDITERKRAREELERAMRIIRQEKGFNDSLLDALPGIFYCFNEDRRLIRWNKSYGTELGIPAAEIRNRHVLDPVFGEDRERVDQAIGEVFRSGKSSIELRIVHTDGRIFWYFCTGVRMDLDGVPYVLGVGIDITERKKAEEALSESEDRFRTIFEMAPDGIFIADETGRLIEANAAACLQLGHDREQLLRLHVTDVVSPRFAARAAARVTGGYVGSEGFYESSHVRADGTEVPVELHVSPVTFRGRPAMMGIARDITERRRAEEERRRLEEQLLQAQKLESVGRLAGGVAHDFNNLLTVINGYSDVVLKKFELNDTVKMYLEQIRRAGQRASTLTQQLLAFSRKQVTQPKPTDLNHVVAEAGLMLEHLMGEKIEVVTHLAPALGVVMADPVQIHQIIMNLLLNARDAMPRGGRLIVETKNIEIAENYATRPYDTPPGSYAMLQVTDTGIGMGQEVRERIFEPFFTTKPPMEGAGLGLCTVYGIVKQNQGWIEVDSEVAIGTTFRIFFPRVDSALRTEESPRPVATALAGHETILVVEDQEDVRGFTVTALTSYGYRVIPADSGPDALRIAEVYTGAIHVLLTDVMMPGMTGLELATQLCPSRTDMKVLYMSAYGENVVSHGGVLVPGIEFLPKPFTAEILAAKIRSLIGAPVGSNRILVVDDEECVREFFREILVSDGYEVLLARNGKEALDAIKGPPIDLVITDLVMPETEGIETIRAIHEHRPQTKVIAVSGAFGGWFLTVAAKLGADATLSKPVQPDQLLSTIRRVLR